MFHNISKGSDPHMKTKRLSLFLALILMLSLILTAVPTTAASAISFNKVPDQMNVGDGQNLTINFNTKLNDETLEWTCSDSSVIKLTPETNATVHIQAIGPGTVVITVRTVNDDHVCSASITVVGNGSESGGNSNSNEDYSDVTMFFDQLKNRYNTGESNTIHARFSGHLKNTSSDVVWTSSNPKVIRLTPTNGNSAKLEALIPGLSTITAKSVSVEGLSCSYTVLVWPEMGYKGARDSSFSTSLNRSYTPTRYVTGASTEPTVPLKGDPGSTKLTLNYTNWDFLPGDATTLTASFVGGSARGDVEWSCSDPSIVSFMQIDEQNMRVDALKPGTATITATCAYYDLSATCKVTVHEEGFEMKPNILDVKASKDGSPVTVPVDNITSGTVAFIVHEDGTEQLLKTCYVDGDDLKVRIDENATLKIVDNKKTFNDLKQGAWYNSAVDFVSARGLMNGTSTTQFSPSVTVNHAMAWTMLANLNDQPISGSSPWYDKSRTWAMENNLTDGSDATGTIERQELATLLWKQAGSPNSTRGFDGFVDADQIDAENVVAMQWALENGIMAGKTGGKMDPTGSTTRAEIAQMFKNFVSSDAYR